MVLQAIELTKQRMNPALGYRPEILVSTPAMIATWLSLASALSSATSGC